MGEVYLVRDEKLRRDVAAKFLSRKLMSDVGAVSRFKREAIAAARITHQNVVRIYSIETNAAGEPFITAEYIKGTDLTTHIRGGPVLLQTAGALIAAIAEGLAAAHAQAVVHRDLKPQNVRVRPDGTPVIVDFGLGRVLSVRASDSTEPQVTQPNQIIGTVNYMSPEQLREQSVGTESDVFSLAVLAFELLTGLRPFDRATTIATISAILSDSPPDLAVLRTDVPIAWRDAISAALAKVPNARPTAADVAQQFTKSWQSEAPIPAQAPTQPIHASATPLLARAFHDNDWFQEHASRAQELAAPVGDVLLELAMTFAEQRELMTIQQLYEVAKSIPQHHASYQGRLFDDDRWRPQRGVDDIYAIINFQASGHFWYWALRKNGDLFLAATLDEKSQPSRLSIETMLREFLVALIYCRSFLERIVPRPHDPALLLRARIRGVAGRVLFGTDYRRAFPFHLEFYGYRTERELIEATVRTSLVALRTNFRGVVEVFFGDVAAYFNFLTVPSDYLDHVVEAIEIATA